MKNKNLLVTIAIIILQFIIIYYMSTGYKDMNNQCAESKKTIDSLTQEILIKDIDLGRYEYTYENIDSACREKVDSIFKNIE